MKIASTLKIPMYECTVTLIITDQINKEINRIIKKYKLELYIEGDAAGTMLDANLEKYWIIIDSKYLSHNTIAHESYHLLSKIASDRGIKDEEAIGWLAGHIAEFIYKFLEKKNLQVKHG